MIGVWRGDGKNILLPNTISRSSGERHKCLSIRQHTFIFTEPSLWDIRLCVGPNTRVFLKHVYVCGCKTLHYSRSLAYILFSLYPPSLALPLLQIQPWTSKKSGRWEVGVIRKGGHKRTFFGIS